MPAIEVKDPTMKLTETITSKFLAGKGTISDANRMMLLSLAQESKEIEPLLLGIKNALNEYNKTLSEQKSLLDTFTSSIAPIYEKASEIVSGKIPTPPTYEEVTTPQTSLEKIFKQVVPSIITAFAFLNPGNYGENFFMVNAMYDAIKANDKELYERKVKEWQLKTETDLKNRELQLKALDYQLKSGDMKFKSELQKLGINVEALKTNIQTQLETLKALRENFKLVRDTLNTIAKNMLEEKKIATEASKANEYYKLLNLVYSKSVSRLNTLDKLLADPTISEEDKARYMQEYQTLQNIVNSVNQLAGFPQKPVEPLPSLPSKTKPKEKKPPEVEVLQYSPNNKTAIIRDKFTGEIQTVNVNNNKFIYKNFEYILEPQKR